MLARTGTGAWRPLESLAQLPSGGFAALCEGNLGAVLDYGAPLVVAGTLPSMAGRPDAVCVDGHGHVAVVVAFHERGQEEGLASLLEAAAALAGGDASALLAACSRLADHGSIERWWRSVDEAVEIAPSQIEGAVAASLNDGPDLVVIVPPTAASSLLTPLRYLAKLTGGRLRCFELAAWVAGDVETVHTSELALAEGASGHAVRVSDARPAEEQRPRAERSEPVPEREEPAPEARDEERVEEPAAEEHVDEPQAVADEAPEEAAEPESAHDDAHDDHEDAPAPEAEEHAEEERPAPRAARRLEVRSGSGSDVAARLLERAEDELGSRHLDILREITEFASHHFDELSIQGTDDYPLLRCDVTTGDATKPMLLLSPDGGVVFDLAAVPQARRDRALSKVSRTLDLTDEPTGSKVLMSIAEHLDDAAHLDAFRDRVMDALEAAGHDVERATAAA
jgi:hypothetical protein